MDPVLISCIGDESPLIYIASHILQVIDVGRVYYRFHHPFVSAELLFSNVNVLRVWQSTINDQCRLPNNFLELR